MFSVCVDLWCWPCVYLCMCVLYICVCMHTGCTHSASLHVESAGMEVQQPCLFQASVFSNWRACLISPEVGETRTAGCLSLTTAKKPYFRQNIIGVWTVTIKPQTIVMKLKGSMYISFCRLENREGSFPFCLNLRGQWWVSQNSEDKHHPGKVLEPVVVQESKLGLFISAGASDLHPETTAFYSGYVAW